MEWRTEPYITERQKEVLELVATGKTYHETADALGIRYHTVKAHMSRINTQLRASGGISAVMTAFRLGLISPPTGRMSCPNCGF